MPEPAARRPAGAIPRDLDEVIDYRPVRNADGVVEQHPVTYMDRLVEAVQLGGFLHDAAARVGVTVETLREWRKLGAAANADVLAGKKRRSHLTKRVRQYALLAQRLETAEAEARLKLLGLGQRLAQGGYERTKTITRTIAATGGQPQLVETTTEVATAEPDPRMITWLLGHRWPADFNRTRVELTGAGGGPIRTDPRSALDQLRAAVETARQPPPNGQEPHVAGTNGHQTNGQ